MCVTTNSALLCAPCSPNVYETFLELYEYLIYVLIMLGEFFFYINILKMSTLFVYDLIFLDILSFLE